MFSKYFNWSAPRLWDKFASELRFSCSVVLHPLIVYCWRYATQRDVYQCPATRSRSRSRRSLRSSVFPAVCERVPLLMCCSCLLVSMNTVIQCLYSADLQETSLSSEYVRVEKLQCCVRFNRVVWNTHVPPNAAENPEQNPANTCLMTSSAFTGLLLYCAFILLEIITFTLR